MTAMTAAPLQHPEFTSLLGPHASSLPSGSDHSLDDAYIQQMETLVSQYFSHLQQLSTASAASTSPTPRATSSSSQPISQNSGTTGSAVLEDALISAPSPLPSHSASPSPPPPPPLALSHSSRVTNNLPETSLPLMPCTSSDLMNASAVPPTEHPSHKVLWSQDKQTQLQQLQQQLAQQFAITATPPTGPKMTPGRRKCHDDGKALARVSFSIQGDSPVGKPERLYDPQGEALFQRMHKWQSKKEDEVAKKLQALQEEEVAECSFHPQVNSRPLKARPSVPASERLYSIGKGRLKEREENQRYYEEWKVWSQCTFRPETNSELNQALQAKPKYNRPPLPKPGSLAAEDMADCTFQPAINPLPAEFKTAQSYLEHPAHERLFAESKKAAPTSPWACQHLGHQKSQKSPPKAQQYYKQLNARAAQEIASLEDMIAQASQALQGWKSQGGEDAVISPKATSEQPKTKSSGMPIAEVWPASPGSPLYTDKEGNSYADLRALMGSLGGDLVIDPEAQLFTSIDPPSPRRYDAIRFEVNGCMVEANYESSAEEDNGPCNGLPEGVLDFTAFLERQNKCERRRQARTQRIQSQLTHSYQPRLCRKSVAMLKDDNGLDSFFDRQLRHLHRKEKAAAEAARAMGKDLTFEPEINEKSQILPARSVTDLTFTDVERLQKKKEKLLKYYNDQEVRELTFKPKINDQSTSSSTHSKSLLLAGNGMRGYTQRLKAREEAREKRRQGMHEMRMKEEERQCTFRPQINEAPDYVRRIAHSLSLLKNSATSDTSSYANHTTPTNYRGT